MQKRTIVFVGILILLCIAGYLLYRNPVVQNKLTALAPSLRKAEEPPANVKEKREGREIGKLLTKTYNKTFSKEEINGFTRPFYASSGQYLPAVYDVDHYTITYNATDEQDVLLASTAQVYLPKVTEQKAFPLYVFGSGTTGIDDACAPSREIVDQDNWGDYRAHMLSYASQGYIVVFPDYEGFNDGANRIHHYFHKLFEAHTMLDAARGAYDFFASDNTIPARAQNAVFFTGYSQGGHAAFAAKDLASSYAPELPVKGVIGYAPTTNVIALLQDSPHLAAYMVVAYKDTYGNAVAAEKIMQQKWLPTLEQDARSKCISDVSTYYPPVRNQIYTDTFNKALTNNLANDFTGFGDALRKNETGLQGNNIPAMVAHGDADPIVTTQTQEAFIKKSCKAGNKITYKNYPGVHHFQSRQVSFKDSLTWMQGILEGKTPPNNCNDI